MQTIGKNKKKCFVAKEVGWMVVLLEWRMRRHEWREKTYLYIQDARCVVLAVDVWTRHISKCMPRWDGW